MNNFNKTILESIDRHSSVFMLLDTDGEKILFTNSAVEDVLGYCKDSLEDAGVFSELLERPKRWRLILKEIEAKGKVGQSHTCALEFKTATNTTVKFQCIFKIVIENQKENGVFIELYYQDQNTLQSNERQMSHLLQKNTQLLQERVFHEYIYNLINTIQNTHDINDIICTVCNRLVQRENNEFSIEKMTLMVRKSDHLVIEYQAEVNKSSQRYYFLDEMDDFIKNATVDGQEIRDQKGSIAFAMHLYDVDQIDAAAIVKFHSEGQLAKEVSELKVIVNSMARQINNIYLTDRLRKESIEDPLTGAFNRRYFDKSLKDEANRAGRHKRDLSVIFLDIDYFKKINDVYGHAQGDRCLIEIVELCKNTGRASDHVYRYGGEEFVILLPETNYKQALIKAEKIRQTVQTTPFTNIQEENQPLQITVSLGVSEYTENDSPESFLANADDALYQAKSSGRNKVVGSK